MASDQSTTSESTSSVPTDWNVFLKQHALTDEDIQRLIFEKHESRQFKDVIGLIQASLIAGRPQPWMYQVLALTMKIEQYPQAEIERVLLSNNDFRPLDVPNLIISAAYLNRFGAKHQALSMYRQASRLAPARPEPYALGLKLAKDLKDDDAILWAAEGILTYDWSSGFQTRHDDAIDTATDLANRLKSAGQSAPAQAIEARIQQASIHDLDVRLEWSGAGDLDLQVEEPGGAICSFEHPLTPAGGALVHDGAGPEPDNCYDAYVCGKGFNGTYKIRIIHAYGDIVSKKGLLVITEQAHSRQPIVTRKSINLTAENVVIDYELKSGRRLAQRQVDAKALSLQQVREQARQSTLAWLHGRRRQVTQTNPDSPATLKEAPAASAGFQSFVVAQQGVGYEPVIVTINEGVSLTAAAVVSADRRYVTLNVSPSFSAISDVFTFTFLGGSGTPSSAANQGN